MSKNKNVAIEQEEFKEEETVWIRNENGEFVEVKPDDDTEERDEGNRC